MMLEYLFTDKENEHIVEGNEFEYVTKEIVDIKDSPCWLLRLSAEGENEETARVLSARNQEIVKRFAPVVITNESSAYYNRRLFPIVNEFERKLRKLLYLAGGLQNDKDKGVSEVIRELESKDLGTIFELLFTDKGFINKVKENVNNKSWQFTKSEILSCVNNVQENTLWKKLFGEKDGDLSSCFFAIRKYRNDVMHAHDIDARTYLDAKRQFENINGQLESEIELLMNPPAVNTEERESLVSAKEAVQIMMDAITDFQREKLAEKILAFQRAIEQLRDVVKSPLINISELFQQQEPKLDEDIDNKENNDGTDEQITPNYTK